MKGDAKVLEYLNSQLKNELTAINQYFLHYRMLKNWGYARMAKHEYEESIGEMKHADKLVDRILMLDGLPNLQDLGKLLVGESAVEVLHCDLKAEVGSQALLKEAIAYCETVRDYVSRELLEEHPRGHRGAHRPPGNTDRPGGAGGRAELAAVADGRDVLSVHSPCSGISYFIEKHSYSM